MKRYLLLLLFLFPAITVTSQELPYMWEELSSVDFTTAVGRAEGVCLIPVGVLEKHGPHLPLGTDVFYAREISLRAVKKEYAVVFPFYFAGQINEARQHPGTVTYSPELLYKILDETCQEISRNGLKKIVLVNGHGGNTSFLQYFCQSQLYQEKDYAVYLFQDTLDRQTRKEVLELRRGEVDQHAGHLETSTTLAIRPDLVRLDRAADEPGYDMTWLKLKGAYTGIWWYASFPNHYSGNGVYNDVALGEKIVEQDALQLASVIRAIKRDNVLELQKQFYEESQNPHQTKVKRK